MGSLCLMRRFSGHRRLCTRDLWPSRIWMSVATEVSRYLFSIPALLFVGQSQGFLWSMSSPLTDHSWCITGWEVTWAQILIKPAARSARCEAKNAQDVCAHALGDNGAQACMRQGQLEIRASKDMPMADSC